MLLTTTLLVLFLATKDLQFASLTKLQSAVSFERGENGDDFEGVSAISPMIMATYRQENGVFPQ